MLSVVVVGYKYDVVNVNCVFWEEFLVMLELCIFMLIYFMKGGFYGVLLWCIYVDCGGFLGCLFCNDVGVKVSCCWRVESLRWVVEWVEGWIYGVFGCDIFVFCCFCMGRIWWGVGSVLCDLVLVRMVRVFMFFLS